MPPANANDIIFAPLPEALPLSLEWDASLVPDGGACVVSPMASPLKSVMKESAGRSFHEKIRIVAGMLGPPRRLAPGRRFTAHFVWCETPGGELTRPPACRRRC